VYDLLGRKVATLADGVFEAGSYSATWDASGFAAGTYLARLTAAADHGRAIHTQTRKLLLVK
jgi:hypothetical protein